MIRYWFLACRYYIIISLDLSRIMLLDESAVLKHLELLDFSMSRIESASETTTKFARSRIESTNA